MILLEKRPCESVCLQYSCSRTDYPQLSHAQLPYNFTPNRGIWVDAGPCTIFNWSRLSTPQARNMFIHDLIHPLFRYLTGPTGFPPWNHWADCTVLAYEANSNRTYVRNSLIFRALLLAQIHLEEQIFVTVFMCGPYQSEYLDVNLSDYHLAVCAAQIGFYFNFT